MVSGTGWTFQQVGEHTLPEITALLGYWSVSPPVNELVATYLGYKRAEANEPTPAEEAQYMNKVSADEFDALLKQHGLPT